MNYRRLLVAGALVLAACAALRPYRFTNYTRNPKAMASVRQDSVAVLYFAGPYGDRLSGEFTQQLGELGRFGVVERRRVVALFRDQDLDPARVDQSTAIHLARMLGARAVVMGTVGDYRQGRVSASLRLIKVETGETAWEGSDMLEGADSRVQALARSREDRDRLRRDPDYLAACFARLVARSIR